MISPIEASGKTETQAVLVRTPSAEYVVRRDCLPHLLDFARTFRAEIHLVTIEEGVDTLDLPGLAGAVCDSTHQNKSSYSEVRRIVPGADDPLVRTMKAPRPAVALTREMIRNRAVAIRKIIRDRLLQGLVVDIADLRADFACEGLSGAAIANHVKRVRSGLEQEGTGVVRTGLGRYRIAPDLRPNQQQMEGRAAMDQQMAGRAGRDREMAGRITLIRDGENVTSYRWELP